MWLAVVAISIAAGYCLGFHETASVQRQSVIVGSGVSTMTMAQNEASKRQALSRGEKTWYEAYDQCLVYYYPSGDKSAAEKMFATLRANEPAHTVMNYDRFDEKCPDGGGMTVIVYHATVSDSDPVDVIPMPSAGQARDNHTF